MSVSEIKQDNPIEQEEKTIKTTKSSGVTPMIQQYLAIKAGYQGHLLFYRMGDFYELFFDDALIAAKELDIVLTKRGKQEGDDIPMCGVPHHACDNYLARLIRRGYKVAICDQVETPEEAKKRGGYKAVVKREVVRVLTPGTLTEENLLQESSNNFLLCVSPADKDFASPESKISLAWCDISTGEFFISLALSRDVSSEIEKIAAKEIIINEDFLKAANARDIVDGQKALVTYQSREAFNPKKAQGKIESFFGVKTLGGFPKMLDGEVAACAGLIDYIELTQLKNCPKIKFPKRSENTDFMEIDKATIKNLEIFSSYEGEYKGSLLSIINNTKTAAGDRSFRQKMARPLMDIGRIKQIHEVVESLIKDKGHLAEVRKILSEMPDFERIISRIYVNRSSPKDLSALRYGLKNILRLQQIFDFAKKGGDKDVGGKLPKLLGELVLRIKNHDGLFSELDSALIEFPSINLNEGGYIRHNYNPKLDDYRNIRQNSNHLQENLLEKYRGETGVPTLKIKSNNVIGTFIEFSPSNADKALPHFIHKQTLANAVRFTTDELREIESKIINADSYAIQLEIDIFRELCAKITENYDALISTASAIAEIDVLYCHANNVDALNLTRPELDKSKDFNIEAGRHLIIEQALKSGSGASGGSASGEFIANDIGLEVSDRVWLITGPNMSGKSTFLRQSALIAILAQVGSFVPASSAKIGVIDKVFSRVGASDNLARGHSTFMVEMVETAAILNNSTDRSFVILDEIGRGTATFDGLSIAWASLEHIHNQIKSRCLFASHYHELTELQKMLDAVSCHKTEIKEWQDEIIFMHKIVAGAAEQSYGIQVAKIAGIPTEVVMRAGDILQMLQKANRQNPIEVLSKDLPLFSNMGDASEADKGDKVEAAVGDGSSLRDEFEAQSSSSVKIEPKFQSRYAEFLNAAPTNKAELVFSTSDLENLKVLRSALDKIDVNQVTPMEALNLLAEIKAKNNF